VKDGERTVSGAQAIPLDTFAERAWYAYLCLPRDKQGKPPPLNQVIGKNRRTLLHNLFKGLRTDARQKTRELIAEALRVDRAWLDHGSGAGPRLTGPYRPMPRGQNLRDLDRMSTPPNNLEIAVWFLGADLDPRAAEEVARDAVGKENARSPLEWGCTLCAAHIRLTGGFFELRLTRNPPATRGLATARAADRIEAPRRAS